MAAVKFIFFTADDFQNKATPFLVLDLLLMINCHLVFAKQFSGYETESITIFWLMEIDK